MQGIRKELRTLVLYCCIGICGVCTDMALFMLLTYIGIAYLLANCFGVCSGIVLNFFLNAHFNFRKTDKRLIRFLKFFSVGMIGLLISSLCLYVFITLMHFESSCAKLISIFIVTCFQFVSNRLITFGN